MTKSAFSTALDSFISAIGKITKSRHTSANDLFLNEFYATSNVDLYSTTHVVTAIFASSYQFVSVKKGNTVHWNLNFKNNSGSTKSNTNILTISNTEFQAKSSINFVFQAVNASIEANANLTFIGGNIFLGGSIGDGQILYSSGTYQTND